MTVRLFGAFFALTILAGTSPAQTTFYGLTASGDSLSNARSLVTFNVTGTGVANVSTGAVSGLAAGQTLQSIDIRNTTNVLYGLATDSLGTTGQFYTISNSGTAFTATAVGATFTFPNSGNGGGPSDPLLNFAFSGANQARIVTQGAQYITVDLTNPAMPAVTGTGGLLTPDTGAPGRVTAVTGANRTPGVISSSLYGYNADAASAVTITPTGSNPDGQQTYVGGSQNLTFPGTNRFAAGLTTTTSGNLYFVAEAAGGFDSAELYTVDTNGNFNQVGGNDILPILYSLTSPVPEPTTVLAVGVGCLGVVARLRRRAVVAVAA